MMIILKPAVRYWVMTNFLWLLILSLLFLTGCFFPAPRFVMYLAGLFALVAVFSVTWSYVVLCNITYIIDVEQIIIKRGVFRRTVDYLEMYRIYDYQKHQNIIEAVFGLMNIVLFSRDMSNPVIRFVGIANDDDVIPVIRGRVEVEKQRKHIIEFNNPYMPGTT
jgi:membrane protein YdbS with pleckstrin-like domain